MSQRWATAALLLACAASVAAGAADRGKVRKASASDAGNRIVAGFTACRAVAADADRLACFDKAASALETAVASKDVAIIDREDIRKTRRSLFGFTLPSFSFLGGGKDDKEEEKEFAEINSTVESARPAGYARIDITLPEGAIWQTTEGLPGVPRKGAKVRIKRGAIGSYVLTVEGRSVKAIRVR